MNINEIRLEMLDLAEELDRVVDDRGPMGEFRPHSDKARRLRDLAREMKGMTGDGRIKSEDFHVWEYR